MKWDLDFTNVVLHTNKVLVRSSIVSKNSKKGKVRIDFCTRTFLKRSFVQITIEISGAFVQPLTGTGKSMSHSGSQLFDFEGVEKRNLLACTTAY